MTHFVSDLQLTSCFLYEAQIHDVICYHIILHNDYYYL